MASSRCSAAAAGAVVGDVSVDVLGDSVPWVCGTCTLENRPLHLQCDACGTARPASESDVAQSFGYQQQQQALPMGDNGNAAPQSLSRGGGSSSGSSSSSSSSSSNSSSSIVSANKNSTTTVSTTTATTTSANPTSSTDSSAASAVVLESSVCSTAAAGAASMGRDQQGVISPSSLGAEMRGGNGGQFAFQSVVEATQQPTQSSQQQQQQSQSRESITSRSAVGGSSGRVTLPDGFAKKRLEKERRGLLNGKISGDVLLKEDLGDEWLVEIKGAEGTLYTGETFTLRFKFVERYPIERPEVVFIGKPPIHPHIYSNGHICLSILSDGWSPALSVQSVCLSLISMLSSCKKKERPVDDLAYCSTARFRSPKDNLWIFHDDTV